jgi:hypothetical protein
MMDATAAKSSCGRSGASGGSVTVAGSDTRHGSSRHGVKSRLELRRLLNGDNYEARTFTHVILRRCQLICGFRRSLARAWRVVLDGAACVQHSLGARCAALRLATV